MSQEGGISILLSGGTEQSQPESLASISSPASEINEHGMGREPERGAAAPGSALPCHKSNNCIEKERGRSKLLPPYRQKSRYRLIMAVEWIVKKYGLEHIGVLTLTFGVPGTGRGSLETRELREQAKDLEFVQNRWHSFNTNVISKRYQDWACVLESHKDRVWHLHVPVVTKEDIRTGTDVETLCNYKLPYWMRRGKHLRNEALAAEWTALRKICCKYRFGRAELLPVWKTGEALARYLAGYLTKSFGMIPPGRKSKLVRFSRGLSQSINMKFSPNTLGNLIYRTRLRLAASMLHFHDYGDFADYFGPRWNYYLGDIIATIPVPMVFGKDEFKRGFAAKILDVYAEDPLPYLDEKAKRKIQSIHSALLNKFTELAFDESADTHWREQTESDSLEPAVIESGADLFETSENPF